MQRRRYQQISDELERQICSGVTPPGAYLPSERVLSARFAVNRATVRRALAQLADRGLIDVLPARGALVRRSAANGRGDSSLSLLALVADASAGSPLMLDVFRTAQLAAQRAGYDLLFYTSHAGNRFSTERREAAWLEHSLRRNVEGLIVWHAGGTASHPVLRRLHARGFPLVLLDRRVEGLSFDLIGIDNEAAGYMATEHLIRLGHRQVGHLTHPMNVNTIAERRHGYERALRDHGLRAREEWIEFTDDEAGAYQDAGIRRLLEREDRPTGVFAVSDRPALRALREAYALGLRVPEEVALAGVDDIPGARTAAVPLTTVRQPFGRMGELAVTRLLDRIGGMREEAATILLPAELVVRSSTDPTVGGEAVQRGWDTRDDPAYSIARG